jgi:hypothetical protein
MKRHSIRIFTLFLVLLVALLSMAASPMPSDSNPSATIDWGQIITTMILLVVIPYILIPLVSWLRALAKQAWQKFESEKPDLAEILEQSAKFAVLSAEQANAGGVIEDKRTYAIETAQKWLAAKGVTMDVGLIEAAIEKAVKDQFNSESPES